MTTYLKLFETTSDYETYINGGGAILPNVSVAKDALTTVYFNPYVEQPFNVIIYTATEKLEAGSSGGGSGSGSGSGGSNTFYEDGFQDENGQTLTITSHTFEDGVGRIEFDGDIVQFVGRTFMNCSSLITISIPNSVTGLGYDTFNGCTNLTSVNIPVGIESIDSWAFKRCESLTNISIPNSVTSIGYGAFCGCSGLTSVTIGNGVTSIGGGAFTECTGLTSITCNATTAPSIEDNTFSSVKTGGTLYVPTGSTGYNVWMGTGDYYLGKYGWTKVEQ